MHAGNQRLMVMAWLLCVEVWVVALGRGDNPVTTGECGIWCRSCVYRSMLSFPFRTRRVTIFAWQLLLYCFWIQPVPLLNGMIVALK